MIAPHGGLLVDRVLTGETRLEAEQKALEGKVPRLDVDVELAKDVENIAIGVYSPLEGFLLGEEFEHVLEYNRLPNDVPWTIPIVLDVKQEVLDNMVDARGRKIGSGSELCLWSEDKPLALMEVEEIYTYDKERLAYQVYGTTDSEHPGVAKVAEMGNWLLGGKISLINYTFTPFARYKLRPVETRLLFQEKGWRTVVAFQTRNAPHIGHEYVQKTALTFVDGIFINPVLGKKKRGDFKDEVIIDSYLALMQNYYLKENTVLAILEYEMQYAGPKEAIHHAIMRKNFGCTHFVVGRDHAGVGNYYSPYEAQEFFEKFPDLGIVPLSFKSFFYCKKCESVANDKTCPHGTADRVEFSGTKIRKFFEEGVESLEGLMRPEVVEAIKKYPNPFVE